MNKNKSILKHCPNFYKIKNFAFEDGDYISLKLVSIYEDFIFSIDSNDINEVKRVESLDSILSKYIDDYNFRKEIRDGLLKVKVKRGTNIVDAIINSIISLFDKYEDGYTRNIYFARWV